MITLKHDCNSPDNILLMDYFNLFNPTRVRGGANTKTGISVQ